LTFKDGSTYKGNFKDGIFDGYGVYTILVNGKLYQKYSGK
jgi:hypothetical protein